MTQPSSMVEEFSSMEEELAHKMRTARRITVLTGAGVSCESGIPTFRDSQTGLWAKYSPQELASPEAFHKDPRLVWDWYAWRTKLVNEAQPNCVHLALAEMERRVSEFTLITQNVDGLHHRAGSQHVIELHGNIRRARCMEDGQMIADWQSCSEFPPRCPKCGATLRPDVVWFGENLSEDTLNAALQASQNCDLYFSIGTSGVIEPAASLPYEALRHGATVVEINPLPTPLAIYTLYSFSQKAGAVLPQLVKAAWGVSS